MYNIKDREVGGGIAVKIDYVTTNDRVDYTLYSENNVELSKGNMYVEDTEPEAVLNILCDTIGVVLI
jgi:hypothetical protein